MTYQTSIYRLTSAIARDSAPVGDVIVRARSPIDARLVAAEAEQQFRNSAQFASRFLDEKAYEVMDLVDTPHARSGPRAALCGDITAKVLRSRLQAQGRAPRPSP